MDETVNNQTTSAPPPAPPPSPPRPARFGGIRRRAALTMTAIGLVTGGIAGGYIVSHAATAATPSASGAVSTGTFHSNESASHEAGESAQREAQENAGQFPTVP